MLHSRAVRLQPAAAPEHAVQPLADARHHDFADGFNTYTITSLYGNDRRRTLTLLVADDRLQGREAIFLSTFVMVGQNRADERRTDIHECYSFSTSSSIAPSVPPPRHSPHG